MPADEEGGNLLEEAFHELPHRLTRVSSLMALQDGERGQREREKKERREARRQQLRPGLAGVWARLPLYKVRFFKVIIL